VNDLLVRFLTDRSPDRPRRGHRQAVGATTRP
jgi:hypothetical protein